MNNGYFFGCSFTSGYGLNFDHEINHLNDVNKSWDKPLIDKIPEELWDTFPYKNFNSYKESYRDKTWTHLVSNHFNLKHINKGITGASNDEIISLIISELSNIETGDYVFINKTFIDRLLIPEPFNLNKMLSINSHNITELIKHDNSRYTKDQLNTLLNYVVDILYTDRDLYVGHYSTLYNNFKRHFEKNGIVCYIWDVNIRENYETIYDWSNKTIEDYHWSINGHKDFSDKVINDLTIYNHGI